MTPILDIKEACIELSPLVVGHRDAGPYDSDSLSTALLMAANVLSLPWTSIVSNSGGGTLGPVVATRGDPKSCRGFTSRPVSLECG